MAREKQFWAWIRPKVITIPDLHIQRIESMSSSGTPDVEGCWSAVPFQIELKSCIRPKRFTTKLDYDVKKSQVFWHEDRYKAGGKSYILVNVETGRKRTLYLVPGQDIRLIVNCTETQLAAVSVCQGILLPANILDFVRRDYYDNNIWG